MHINQVRQKDIRASVLLESVDLDVSKTTGQLRNGGGSRKQNKVTQAAHDDVDKSSFGSLELSAIPVFEQVVLRSEQTLTKKRRVKIFKRRLEKSR